MSTKPEVELTFYHFLYGKSFHVKYLENSKRYEVGLGGGQIGNQPWAFNWLYEL